MIISSINLWCSKNLVDMQFLLGKVFSFENSKLQYSTDPFSQNVKLVFLNTCWFLSTSRNEMFATIEELLESWKKIYLLWCSVQYFENLIKNNIDSNYNQEYIDRKNIIKNKNVFLLSWEDAKNISYEDLKNWFSSLEFMKFTYLDSPRLYSNIDLWFEYLKIAEWCDNQCSFCIIPKIRWKQQSVSIEKILSEVNLMIKNWVKEIIIISQDTTRYWTDIYGEAKLLDLLEKIDNLKWNFLYRILYLYPDIMTINMIKKLSKLKKFIPYFDIPLQHINWVLLKKMWRFSDTEKIINFIYEIKKTFQESFIRTNFIIWFPLETEKMAEELNEFIKKWILDNISIFQYHDEILAPSSKFSNKVNDIELKKRFRKTKTIWENIFTKKETKRKSKEQIWIIEKISNNWKATIRPRLHCPEVDSTDEINLLNISEVIDSDILEIWVYVKYKI